MVSSIAYTLGFGSGIDTKALVSELAAASRAPKIAALNSRAAGVQTKISAIGQIKSQLDSFNESLAEVVKEGSFRALPTSSDASVLTVKRTPSGSAEARGAVVQVNSLATAQTVYSAAVANVADAIGEGTFSLNVGGVAHDITIDSSNNSLTGLAAAINQSNSGVSASLINNGTGTQLVLKGEVGAAKSFTLTQTAGDPALSAYEYGGGASAMTLAQAAGDAVLNVDGIAVTRGSNSINDIVPGVVIDLVLAAPGKSVTIGAQPQTDALKTTIKDFISVYNEMRDSIQSARTSIGSDVTLRQFERSFAQMTTKALTNHAEFSTFQSIGISTGRDGKLTLDESKLNTVLESDGAAVVALFAPPRETEADVTDNPGIYKILSDLNDAMLGDNGVVTAMTDRLTAQAEAIEKVRQAVEERETRYSERLEKQFGGMEAKMASIKATQAYMEQQIKMWSGGE